MKGILIKHLFQHPPRFSTTLRVRSRYVLCCYCQCEHHTIRLVSCKPFLLHAPKASMSWSERNAQPKRLTEHSNGLYRQRRRSRPQSLDYSQLQKDYKEELMAEKERRLNGGDGSSRKHWKERMLSEDAVLKHGKERRINDEGAVKYGYVHGVVHTAPSS